MWDLKSGNLRNDTKNEYIIFSILNMETADSSEGIVPLHQPIESHISDDSNIQKFIDFSLGNCQPQLTH
jgi:hypothetical protein